MSTCSKCGQLAMFELSPGDDDSTFLCAECKPKPVESLHKEDKCRECGGEGVLTCDLDHEHECPECEGTGEAPDNV